MRCRTGLSWGIPALSTLQRSIPISGASRWRNGLSVEVVCRVLGVSTSYFSTVFKKETGKTFIKYLTEFRMEKAADLLLTKEEKTYMIAEKVGYSDSNYFSYVFKRQFGMPPSKYRAGLLEKRP